MNTTDPTPSRTNEDELPRRRFSRRGFLGLGAAAGAGLLVGCAPDTSSDPLGNPNPNDSAGIKPTKIDKRDTPVTITEKAAIDKLLASNTELPTELRAEDYLDGSHYNAEEYVTAYLAQLNGWINHLKTPDASAVSDDTADFYRIQEKLGGGDIDQAAVEAIYGQEGGRGVRGNPEDAIKLYSDLRAMVSNANINSVLEGQDGFGLNFELVPDSVSENTSKTRFNYEVRPVFTGAQDKIDLITTEVSNKYGVDLTTESLTRNVRPEIDNVDGTGTGESEVIYTAEDNEGITTLH